MKRPASHEGEQEPRGGGDESQSRGKKRCHSHEDDTRVVPSVSAERAAAAPSPAPTPGQIHERVTREMKIYQIQDHVIADAVLQFHQRLTPVDSTRKSNVMLTLSEWHIMQGDLETVRLLLDHNMHVEAEIAGFRGWLPISIACKHDQLEILKLLVPRGAQVNRDLTVHGASPFAIACSYGHFEIIKWLVENGA